MRASDARKQQRGSDSRARATGGLPPAPVAAGPARGTLRRRPHALARPAPRRARLIQGILNEYVALLVGVEVLERALTRSEDAPPEQRAPILHNLAKAAADATVHPLGGGRAEVRLHQPQAAISPGQACVIYQGDRLIGVEAGGTGKELDAGLVYQFDLHESKSSGTN